MICSIREVPMYNNYRVDAGLCKEKCVLFQQVIGGGLRNVVYQGIVATDRTAFNGGETLQSGPVEFAPREATNARCRATSSGSSLPTASALNSRMRRNRAPSRS
jgi:hypothetical protein